MLNLLVEARISGEDWYVVAAAADGLILAHLSSDPGPQVSTFEPHDLDGISVRILLDAAVGFADYRSWFKNSGST